MSPNWQNHRIPRPGCGILEKIKSVMEDGRPARHTGVDARAHIWPR